jgi:hypothetical protein
MALAACNNGSQKNDKRSATGEVLEGTTSDAMIPLGELTSQPPLLPPTGKGPKTPEQAADQASGSPLDVTSASSGDGAAPAATGAPAAAPSAAP